jgi:hypothetical protein
LVFPAFPRVNPNGTPAAKEEVMLTVSTFFIAMASVFSSVVWACKEEPSNRG